MVCSSSSHVLDVCFVSWVLLCFMMGGEGGGGGYVPGRRQA